MQHCRHVDLLTSPIIVNHSPGFNNITSRCTWSGHISLPRCHHIYTSYLYTFINISKLPIHENNITPCPKVFSKLAEGPGRLTLGLDEIQQFQLLGWCQCVGKETNGTGDVLTMVFYTRKRGILPFKQFVDVGSASVLSESLNFFETAIAGAMLASLFQVT